MAPTLGYWNIRGLGQAIRLMLAHIGIEHEEKRYVMSGTELTALDLSDWTSVKFTLGMDLPNLPYWFDDDVKLSQSGAILKYLGRKHDLAPVTERQLQRCEVAEGEAWDLRFRFVRTCYHEDFETMRDGFVQSFIARFKLLSHFLGTNPYFAGDKLTYVDFLMYDLLDVHLIMEPEALKGLDNLAAFQQRVASLDNVAAYIKSDRFVDRPLLATSARFGVN